MKLFKPYRSIPNYLKRFTLLQIGRLHIRIHRIESTDQTSGYHNHPFSYVSIPLKGSYVEKYPDGSHKKVSLFNIAVRAHNVYHRIEQIHGNVYTLFITWSSKSRSWGIINNDTAIEPGMYQRRVNGKIVHSKFDKGWYIGNTCYVIASQEQRYSIYQTELKPE
jgi:hypothetical protein